MGHLDALGNELQASNAETSQPVGQILTFYNADLCL